MEVEVAILGFPSLTVLIVSVDVKQDLKKTEFRSCVKVQVVVLGFSVPNLYLWSLLT